MDKDETKQAGATHTGKQEDRSPETLDLKARRARLSAELKKKERLKDGVTEKSEDESEDATTGDDFYVDVLKRFGIQI